MEWMRAYSDYKQGMYHLKEHLGHSNILQREKCSENIFLWSCRWVCRLNLHTMVDATPYYTNFRFKYEIKILHGIMMILKQIIRQLDKKESYFLWLKKLNQQIDLQGHTFFFLKNFQDIFVAISFTWLSRN